MSIRIAELVPQQTVESFFVVTQVREGTTRTGSRYVTLSLQDRTGTIAARIWSPDTAGPLPTPPAICRVRGRTESYRDELQLNIDAVELYAPLAEEFDCLVPASRWTPEQLGLELRHHIETHVRAPVLRRLLLGVLDDPGVGPRFLVSPAASANHHAYRCGLAEHTLSMMRLASLIAQHYAAYYPGVVDGDLLVAGVLLHDMGKVWELQGDLAADYSTVGRLVGHIPLGAAYIAERARLQGDVPDALVWELQHLILAHHGEYEFGSPKRPKTVEAQLLHYIDNLDARTNIFVTEAKEAGWTGFHRALGRPILNPAELRAGWTSPPAGAISDEGPGGRFGARTNGETSRAARPTQPTGDAPTTRFVRGSGDAPTVPVTAQADRPGPQTAPTTLSLFDGLD